MSPLADRLRTAFADARAPELQADGRFVFPPHYTPAAVLVAVVDRAEPGVILTLRQSSLRRHAGQIAFPGGRIDPEDAGPVAAALREAHEEIALDPAAVEVVAPTPMYLAGSGYAIVPVIGLVPPDLPLLAAEAEVAAVFEVPLAFLAAEANHVLAHTEIDGHLREYHEINWQDRRIWGITAGMIVRLAPFLARAL